MSQTSNEAIIKVRTGNTHWSFNPWQLGSVSSNFQQQQQQQRETATTTEMTKVPKRCVSVLLIGDL
jgi:hypothetical protein